MPAVHTRSNELAQEARKHMPGGVNSPVRAFRAVGGEPILFSSARGCRLLDVDGNEYIDLVGSWGPMILGHAYPQVVQAVQEAASRGLSFGATTEGEIRLAETVKQLVPSIELFRLVNSGTEACMSALRVARGFTGRDRIVKFAGCYHGHSDSLLVKAGSGALTLGVPDSSGIPSDIARNTLTLRFNDPDAVRDLFADEGDSIAAVILEPVVGNMGVVPPDQGFLQLLREETQRSGALLVFDEVMTGFRLAPGGAQELYQITPDLTCLGKILGGGLPLAGYGGRRDIMEVVAPLGPVYQAGTLSGNPVAVAAGLAMLKKLGNSPGLHDSLDNKGRLLEEGLQAAIAQYQAPARVQRVGSMLTIFFTTAAVTNFDAAQTCRTDLFAAFFQGMLAQGIYLPPSQFEAAFLSTAHTREDIQQIVEAATRVLADLKA
ncbi:glutamate-1-semialdehyde-2,1-aminomutase [bacterium CPR1]|nr:glutamate-1-semialdehyde-2,1-aminomutase [bacterium CPR1]